MTYSTLHHDPRGLHEWFDIPSGTIPPARDVRCSPHKRWGSAAGYVICRPRRASRMAGGKQQRGGFRDTLSPPGAAPVDNIYHRASSITTSLPAITQLKTSKGQRCLDSSTANQFTQNLYQFTQNLWRRRSSYSVSDGTQPHAITNKWDGPQCIPTI